MFRNYLKTALRNLVKQRFYTLINVFGLAIGIACCLLIFQYVQDELSYDTYHEKADRIYRVAGEIVFGGNDMKLAVVPAPMAEALENDYPEIEVATRFRMNGSYLVKRGEEDNIKENRLVFADPDVFEVFTLPFVAGDPATALKDPNTLVINASTAEKYFGKENPIGQTLRLDNRQDYKITGVIEDMPVNSHFQFDFFMSMEGYEDSKNTIWLSNNYNTYFTVKEGTDIEALSAKIPLMIDKYILPQAKQIMNISMEEFEAAGNRINYYLQPVTDIHLHSNLTAEMGPNGDMTYVYLFSAIALFILIIAAINFMNLSTARSANRAREVGVRKVLGSIRGQLVAQFLVESTLLSVIAFGLAIVLANILIEPFNDLANKSLSIPVFNPMFLLGAIGGALVIGMLAGIYPAFFLSAFKPIQVLKGKFTAGVKSGGLRSTLVVFQFATTICLIVGTLIVYQQLNYVQKKKLGFDKDQVLILHDVYALGDQLQSFKHELLTQPQINQASVSSYLPVNSSRSDNGFWPEGTPTEENMVSMQYWSVDHDYVKTMGMEIVQGRDFSLDFPTDSSGIILNETALKYFRFEGDPIGQRVSTFTGPPSDPNNARTYTVVGIVKDFHFESLRENIGSLCLIIGRSAGSMSLRVNTPDMAGLLTTIEDEWKSFAPGQPFAYSFLDERFDRMYSSERRIGNVFSAFAFLAILIACLGLFALAAFMAEQRTKEIGIRKVLGASISNIMVMLSKDFVKLVGIAFLIAAPLTWYAAFRWLESYAYRIEIKPWIFLAAGLIALIIAMATVSSQSFKAAYTNPADALKDE